MPANETAVVETDEERIARILQSPEKIGTSSDNPDHRVEEGSNNVNIDKDAAEEDAVRLVETKDADNQPKEKEAVAGEREQPHTATDTATETAQETETSSTPPPKDSKAFRPVKTPRPPLSERNKPSKTAKEDAKKDAKEGSLTAKFDAAHKKLDSDLPDITKHYSVLTESAKRKRGQDAQDQAEPTQKRSRPSAQPGAIKPANAPTVTKKVTTAISAPSKPLAPDNVAKPMNGSVMKMTISAAQKAADCTANGSAKVAKKPKPVWR
ncbi:hypothetical protein BZG36_01854 [Bifiguratus adelaidae]|uniref:Uncharacterized protein n=1 Tax=Bifiguratus adelaidae TaxID=1938954 RepID=A0A261Y2H6_9FUNG|nr:hypothetical protein BZG36_01854 [Bifiguratus adelaidae]